MTQELISLLVGNLDKLSLAILLLNLQKKHKIPPFYIRKYLGES
jgi:hypothetical protein